MTKRILVVDDDRPIRLMLRDNLEDAGYHVDTLDNLGNVVAAVAAHQPDLVLLDVMMMEPGTVPPNEAGGLTALTLLAAHHGPPVILMSSYANALQGERIAEQGRASGAVAFLSKPFDLDELLAVVAAALEDRKGATP